MLDIKRIRTDYEQIMEVMKVRGENVGDIGRVVELDKEKRALLSETEALKAKQNEVSRKIPALKKAGEDVQPVFEEMKRISEQSKELDQKIRTVDEELRSLMMCIPNIPHESVPVGESDEDNVEVRRSGEPRQFPYEPLAHWDIGENLDIIDFARGVKTSGARFTFYKGLGARLERAVLNFYMDSHSENGYTEVLPPYLVRRESMEGTGQLPKFEEDAFKTAGEEYFLIPTAEVPVTNMHREEILDGNTLPLKYCAYSACFREEAGSAGRDTRGLILYIYIRKNS